MIQPSFSAGRSPAPPTKRNNSAMNKFLDLTGTVVGVTGILVCILAVATRVGGEHYLLGTETRMWLLGGITLIVIGCFAKLQVLSKTL